VGDHLALWPDAVRTAELLGTSVKPPDAGDGDGVIAIAAVEGAENGSVEALYGVGVAASTGTEL
jgi:hypothetical protein